VPKIDLLSKNVVMELLHQSGDYIGVMNHQPARTDGCGSGPRFPEASRKQREISERDWRTEKKFVAVFGGEHRHTPVPG
jgi:hypothetical protein